MQLIIVKIGGNIIDDKDKLKAFLQQFSAVDGYKILVHGGGKVATEIGNKLGIEANYINGRRITDEDTLALVTMVYGGLINRNIVAQLQAMNCNAIGLTGADGGVMPAIKRPVKDVDYGFVGDIDKGQIKKDILDGFLRSGLIPVIAPLTHDGKGSLLNTNADTIAQELAKAMSGLYEVQLVYCFEKKGVLSNADDDNAVISKIGADDLEYLKDNKIITDGMIPKLENALAAVNNGVSKVVIGHADELDLLIKGKAGTCIQ